MQVCLDECHRVRMEACNLFPGPRASRPATTGALWPGPGSQRVYFWRLRRCAADVLGSAGGDVDVNVEVSGSV